MTRGPLDFAVVGNPKSGTTSLAAMLAQHPDLFLCEPKEPYFYAPDLCRAEIGPFRPMSEPRYQALFADARPHQRRGEASACYTISDQAIERLAEANPGMRALLLFREPVAFLRSWHLQLLRDPRLEDEPDLGRALALEADRRAGRHLPPQARLPEFLAYRERVRYAAQLERARAAFGADRVLPLIFADLVGEPGATLRRAFTFLGVDPDPTVEPQHRNPGVRVRRARLEAAALRIVNPHPGDRWPYRAAGRALHALPDGLVHLGRRAARRALHAAPPELPADLAAELRVELQAEVAALGDALGLDLVERWGYDRR